MPLSTKKRRERPEGSSADGSTEPVLAEVQADLFEPAGAARVLPGPRPPGDRRLLPLPRVRRGDTTRLDNVYFRQLFENSPEATVLLDNRDLVVDCNAAFEDLFDYERQQTWGRPINSLIVPAGAAAGATELSREVLAGGEISAEKVRRRRDGSAVTVHILGFPIFQGQRQIGIFGIYRDIGARKRAEKRLRLQGAAMSAAANAIFITRHDGRIAWVNDSFVRLSGYSRSEALGRTPRILEPGRGESGLDPKTWRQIELGGVWRGRVPLRRRNGLTMTVDQTVTPIADPGGNEIHFVVVQEDVSAQIHAEKRLQHMARHDSLTGLPNRYTFHERLEIELDRAARLSHPVAVLVLDLDHFKDVNDTYGHPVGDELLVAVTKRLGETLREGGTLARLGGDEFAMVQADLNDLENATGLARRLLSAFKEPFGVDGRQIHAAASIGIAVYPPGRADSRHLVKKADMALYRAKAEGRGTFRFYQEEMDREVQSRMQLGQDLHGALDRGELFLEYQPVVEVSDRRIVAVEALLRWRHPRHGLIPPERFVPIAEGSGLIVGLGEWVLRTACAQARAWHRERGVEFPVAVNLSAVQFKDPRFVDVVTQAVRDAGLPARLLELELTEGLLMQARSVEGPLGRLHRLGVRFVLDDFGKGYSSLEYLRRFPLGKLKIDRAFVGGLETDANDAVIVGVVAMLGRKLGLEVVAEGVERHSQLELLVAEGCRQVQGHYFSRPLSARAISRLLEECGGRIPDPAAAPAEPAAEPGGTGC